MNPQTVWVPFTVLNDRTHSVITRLVWLLLGRNPGALPDATLSQLSGLDPKTVAAARARLTQAPLTSCFARPTPACAAIPWSLLTTAGISAGARLLYGQLQGAPGFARERGSFTYAALSRLTGTSDDTLRRAVAELVTGGWLTTEQANRKRPVTFTLRNPISPGLRARISHLRHKVRNAEHRGETLLLEFLQVLIAVNAHEDNAAPEFLLNPYSGELMELDRYYPDFGIAVEFNGAQHYEETELATFTETVKQVGRDAMKAFICKARGINLVIIHPEDLTLATLDRKIPKALPRRPLGGQEPLVAALEEMAAEYRERTAQERARKGARRSFRREDEA